MLCRICKVHTQPRNHVLDHAGFVAPTRQRELDHTDHISPERSRLSRGNSLSVTFVCSLRSGVPNFIKSNCQIETNLETHLCKLRMNDAASIALATERPRYLICRFYSDLKLFSRNGWTAIHKVAAPHTIYSPWCSCLILKSQHIDDIRGLDLQVNDWFGAAKKTLLPNANKMLLDMQEFDKDNIPDKVIAVRKNTFVKCCKLLLFHCGNPNPKWHLDTNSRFFPLYASLGMHDSRNCVYLVRYVLCCRGRKLFGVVRKSQHP